MDDLTVLTEQSLEEALMQMAGHLEAMEERISLRPTHLIVPPVIFSNLMYRTPIRKVNGIRKRKRALYWRSTPKLWKLFRSNHER